MYITYITNLPFAPSAPGRQGCGRKGGKKLPLWGHFSGSLPQGDPSFHLLPLAYALNDQSLSLFPAHGLSVTLLLSGTVFSLYSEKQTLCSLVCLFFSGSFSVPSGTSAMLCGCWNQREEGTGQCEHRLV